MTRPITLKRHDEEQKDLRERELHEECHTVKQAAKALHLERESVRNLITRHGLGHRSPWGKGITCAWHLTLADLHAAYPFHVARQPRIKSKST